MPQEQLLSIDIQRTLEFFDEKPEWSRGHATAIVGVLGEIWPLLPFNIANALRPMQPPDGQTDRRILPLLIFWQPLGPSLQSEHENQAEGGHIFSLPRPQLQFEFEVSDTAVPMYPFPELWVFSVSSYLRSLSQPIIQLEMPNALARLHVLNRLTNLLET